MSRAEIICSVHTPAMSNRPVPPRFLAKSQLLTRT
jgi:hypothetical protein